ncbi:MAG: MFS transporter [Rubrivivax sp.]|nr:MFS transporter [Rubrivivax sp.]
MSPPEPARESSSKAPPASIAPLVDNPVFRGLWIASLAANLAMWMNDVAAAWLMTSLTTSPVLVALVSTAATLPVFLLGLPSGALADIVDRRRMFAATQLWVSINALVLLALSTGGWLTAPLLLLLVFGNGIGLAMRWPVFSAIVPQIVGRAQLPQALALNGISMNLSRVAGPMFAGALLAGSGAGAVFALNAALAVLSFVLILRWKSEPRASALPGERFVAAMRVGINYALQSPRLKIILARIFLFFLQVVALSALLPLVARRMHGAGPGTFTLMLSCLGVGAIVAALLFPRWRARFDRDQFVRIGTLVHAAVSSLIVAVPEVWLALPAMFVIGMAWISVANSLTVSAQMAMPDWVRARGMSIYQMGLMGGAACGSLVWGQVASWIGVAGAVWAAAGFGLAVLVLTWRLTVEGGREPDFTPASVDALPEPQVSVAPDDGPVMVTIQYQIDPARAAEFAEVMQRTRRARLRQGALSWALLRDVAVPGRYVEYFVDETWLEHLRRLERFTAFDAELRARRLAFHIGPEPPRVRRYVGDAHLTPADLPPMH